ncbi:MAG: hypothetical protein R3E31_05170 [Chloroflexota bacterium]
MEAVDTGPQRQVGCSFANFCSQIIGQDCFSGRVDAINRHAQRVAASDACQPFAYFGEQA